MVEREIFLRDPGHFSEQSRYEGYIAFFARQKPTGAVCPTELFATGFHQQAMQYDCSGRPFYTGARILLIVMRRVRRASHHRWLRRPVSTLGLFLLCFFVDYFPGAALRLLALEAYFIPNP